MKKSRSSSSKKPKDNDKDKLNKGIFANKWVRYTDIVTTLEKKKKEGVLQVQFIRFLLFFGLLMGTIQLSTRVTEDYHVQKALMEAYIEGTYLDPENHGNEERYQKFHDINGVDDFWQWMETIVVEHTFKHEKILTSKVGQKLKKGWYINNENQLLWGVSIRQQRRRKASVTKDCKISAVATESGILGPKDCILEYVGGTSRQTNGYGGLVVNQINESNTTTTYLYEFQENTGAGSLNPGGYYDHGPDGYVVDLLASSTKQEIIDQIKTLQCKNNDPVAVDQNGQPLWDVKLRDRSKCEPYIDEETTALFVLIQVYNPTYNVFARLETATVFPLSGSVYNEVNVKGGYLVMNVDKQYKPAQQLSTSFVLVIFMVMESLLWIYEMYEGFISLNKSAVLDVIVHCLSVWFISQIVADSIFDYTTNNLKLKLATTNKVEDIHDLLVWKMDGIMVLAYLQMSLILQFFKYLGVLNRRLQIVYNTLLRVTGDLIYWLGLLTIVLIGLVVSGLTFFGSDTKEFSTATDGFNTILRLVIMDFQYQAVSKAPVYIIMPYYIMSSVVIYFLLLNLFTTIILHAWDVEKTYFDFEQAAKPKTNDGWTLKKIGTYIVTLRWLSDIKNVVTRPVYYGTKVAEYYREMTAKMDPGEVAIRIQAWHARRENTKKYFLEFIDVKTSMEGQERNRRVVSDYQVQIVLKYMVKKNDGDPQLLFNVKEKNDMIKQMEGQEIIDEAAEDMKNKKFDSITAMKRLVATMGALEMYQQNVWKDCLQAMNDVKLQTREARRRAVGVRDRLDKLIPKGASNSGGVD